MKLFNTIKIISNVMDNDFEKAIENISDEEICNAFDKSRDFTLKLKHLLDEDRESKKRIEQLSNNNSSTK